MLKKQKSVFDDATTNNHFDLLSEEIVLSILDCLSDENPIDKKSFCLVSKSFYAIESCHRKTLKPLRPEYLTKILNRYPHVAHLDLSLCPSVTDSSLVILSSLCNDMLRSINLSRSRSFTHMGLSNLVMNCRNLSEIDLSNATEINDLAAASIAEAKILERLWLVRCKSVTDIGIGCIAVGCRKLRLLSLKWCLGIGDLGVGLIAVKCKEIRSLDLSYLPSLDMSSCHNVSHKGLSSLTSRAGCLQQLILAYGSPVTHSVADSLLKLSKLQSIKLDGCQVTCSGLMAIGNRCASLREMSLSKCFGVTDEGLSSLVTKQKDLWKLDITCCRKITHVSISHITNSCTSLTSLRMESCSLVSQEAFILIGERCLFLEELDLTDNEVNDKGLKSISRCSKLSSLKLGICLNITDAGFIYVGMCCSELKELDLYRSAGITDLGVMAIARGCTSLEMINLEYCRDTTDCSFKSLSKCPRLNTLETRGCGFITSRGLEAIAMGCKQLAKLDIKKCHKIDDAGMIPLACFSQNLRQINLSYTSITDVGLSSLASFSCLQSVTVLHLSGLTCVGLAAALLACRGLTKVKLHKLFKSLLQQSLLEHLESRGCIFEFREKMFQAELNPKCWKLQLDDVE